METIVVVPPFIVSCILVFTVVFLLFKDWREQVNRFYALFAFSAFLIFFTMFLQYAFPNSSYLTQWNRLTQMGSILMFASLLNFSFVFPKSEKKFPFIYTIMIMLPALVISYFIVFTDLSITRAYFEENRLVREFRFFYRIYMVFVFIYLLLSIVNFSRKYLITRVEIFRRQMRIFFTGTSIGTLIGAITAIILPGLFGYSGLYTLGASFAAFIAISSLIYPIISYQMMDITTAIHKTVMYAVISMVIFLPIYLIIKIYDMNMWIVSEFPPLIIAGSTVVVFLLFSSYIQPVIDKAFKRRQYEFEDILDNFIRDSEGINDFKSLVQRSIDILADTLFLKNAFFITFNNETKRYEPFYQRGDELQIDPLDRNSIIIRWFVRNKEILHLDKVYMDEKSFGEIREDFIEFFAKNRIKLILPMYQGQRILGLMCLGDKDSLVAYKPDELLKLQFFQKETNVQIANTLTYEEVMRGRIVDRTIELSSDIMSRSVPLSLPNLRGIKFGALLIPKFGEGVDYFDFLRPGNQGIGVIATDVSGVGVNSSIHSIMLRSAFQTCLNDATSTYSVMQRLNRVLYEYTGGEGELVTAYYFYYDIKAMRLIYTNAGFPALEVYRIEKNDFDSLDTEGIPLGNDPASGYGMGRTNLLRGDIGVLLSKALISSKNQKGEYFEMSRLRAIVKDNRGRHPNEIAKIINDNFSSFIGLSSPESDIVVIVFKIV